MLQQQFSSCDIPAKVPASHPCNMSPSGCTPVRPDLYLEEKDNYL